MDLNEINIEILKEVVAAVKASGASRVRIGDLEIEFSTPAPSADEVFLRGLEPATTPAEAFEPRETPAPRPTGYAALFRDGKLPSFRVGPPRDGE